MLARYLHPHKALLSHSVAFKSGVYAMSLVLAAPLFAAAGWSLLYLLCGGGVVGAIVLFFVLKSVGA